MQACVRRRQWSKCQAPAARSQAQIPGSWAQQGKSTAIQRHSGTAAARDGTRRSGIAGSQDRRTAVQRQRDNGGTAAALACALRLAS